MTMPTSTIGSRVSASGLTPKGNVEDVDYDAFLERIQTRFSALIASGVRLFTTDADGLWEAYLQAFPEGQRQHHNCSACRHFIERFGAIVYISSGGLTGSAIWDEGAAPDLYKPSIAAMERLVRRAKVTGVFLSPLGVWGTPETGVWRHFAVTPPSSMRFQHAVHTAGQAMAEKREDFNNVARALAEFTPPMVEQALTLLKSEALYRSEKVLGQAQWLRDLHVARSDLRGLPRENVLWRAIADAPAGFCHPRASMIGTLLEDLEQGLAFETVAERFRKKMNPLAYQRPQAAPTAGNIAAAEKLVEKLGIARSLDRRFARLEEVEALWKPAPPAAPKDGAGVFSHLTPKGEADASPMRLPTQTITWEKFLRTVLPEAQSIELGAPNQGNYVALVTAQHPDAPPILQWDSVDQRNPVSHYVYNGGSNAASWGVSGWTKVTAISLEPSSWHGRKLSHQGQAVMFLLEGCKDSRNAGGGNAIFPENLKAEFHAIRSTIEAFSKTAKLEGFEEASACGIMASKGQAFNVSLRVTTSAAVCGYLIDRFD